MVEVLVIEETEVIRTLLIEYMTELGYMVDFALDGQKGVELALENDYKIIFCDSHLPVKNGYLVFKEIHKEKPESFIILMDSFPARLAREASQKGAFRILAKPFDLSDIDNILSEITTRVKAKR
jgi:DNA-binding NtrC family response regulator